MTKQRLTHIGFFALTAASLSCLLAAAGCSQSNASVGGSAHLPIYHQIPGQPSPADQAQASMARRNSRVSLRPK